MTWIVIFDKKRIEFYRLQVGPKKSLHLDTEIAQNTNLDILISNLALQIKTLGNFRFFFTNLGP